MNDRERRLPERVQLHRALSKLGYASRRVAAEMVARGEVTVNGAVERNPLRFVSASDRIEVPSRSGERRADAALVVAMHKPRGHVTTRSDERGRPTVYALLPPELSATWLFPVGRLDQQSEGLLLFTNDGPLGDALTDPARHVAKVYRVKLDRALGELELESFRTGIELDGARTLPCGIEPEPAAVEGRERWYRITLIEGRNRQIRRMCESFGRRVRRLVRLAVGPVELAELPLGACRELGAREVEALRLAAGLPAHGVPVR